MGHYFDEQTFDEQINAARAALVAFPAQCIHELFDEQVARTPDAVALIAQGDAGRTVLTYGELSARSNQLAHFLQGLGVGPDVPVGICVERSLEMVVGLLAILKAGGAYVPLDPAYPQERLVFMRQDAQAQVLVTQEQILSRLPLDAPHVVCLDRDWPRIAQEPADAPTTGVTAEHLAYVIYTSGSTGRPKGVLGLHRGAVNRFHWMWEHYPFAVGEVCCQKTSLSFVDSVWEIFGPLLRGIPLVIASAAAASDPQQLVELLAEEDVTRLVLVPSLLRVLLAGFSDSSEVGTDRCDWLPKLTVWVSSGEALSPQLCRDFHRLLPNRTLLNLYGSSEVSADATWYDTKEFHASSLTSVPIGRPISNMQVYILDEALQPVPAGSAGEIYVGGVGLARGYNGRPALTEEKFIPNPFGGGRLYQTGDLGRYIVTAGENTGNIEFLGRIDHQVKIRGIRIELGEIEARLAQHPTVRECVVVAQDEPSGDKRLVAYVVRRQEALSSDSSCSTGLTDQDAQAEPLPAIWRRFIRQTLPDAFVPSSFVLLDALPLTPNGKIDRGRLPAPARGTANVVPPRTPTEERIMAIWHEVLGLEACGIHDDFFELGGHSLPATQVITRLRQAFSVELSLHTLFEVSTVAGLAARIEQGQANSQAAELFIPSTPQRAHNEPLPLSFAQSRLWFLDQLGSGSDYNMSFAWHVHGKLNITALAHSLTALVGRHETLRTTFLTVNGEPRQRIGPPPTVPQPVPLIDLQALPADEQAAAVARLAIEESLRLFDLTKDLLLRVTLVRLGEEAHVLLVTMHHIASDGWSMAIFVDELATLYNAYANNASPCLPELALQYSDFVTFQRQFLHGERLARLLAYWQGQLAGAPQQLPLPTRVGNAPATAHAALMPVHIGAELSEKMQQLCRRAGVTLFMGLLTAFKILLSRYSNQEDIVVGTPIANRNWPEIEPLIGFFVNTLVLRTDLSGNPSFLALVERVRQTTIGAYEHQDLPFEQLVEALHPTRELNGNPLFQVMFALQPGPDPVPALSGVQVSRHAVSAPTVRFDLEVDFWEGETGLEGTFAYRRDLFDEDTIQRMVGHFHSLLAGIVSNPSQSIGDLPLLSAAERRQLLVEWNNHQRPLPAAPTILQLFTAQVAAGAARVAVVAPAASPRAGETAGARLTYQALDHQANQLAHYLQQLGVGPEVLVGIALDTEVRLIVAVLAVLKAGGAYLPLDPSYPTARLAFMVNDAQVKVLLTQEGLLPALPTPADATVVCLDRDWQRIAQEPTDAPTTNVTAEHLAYVIYTSGSTGKPKGVMVPHGTLVNAYEAWADAYRLAEVQSHLQLASFSFDVFVGNLVRALCSGGKLVLCPREWLLDAPRLSALMAAEQVDCAEFVPAVLRNLVAYLEQGGQNPLHEMRLLIVGSDIWYMHEYQQVRRFCGPQTRLINSYGVTEATIDSSYFEQSLAHPPIAAMQTDEAGERMAPIGRPFANTQLYILDRNRQPVPIGVAGELYIGGAGLARGYLNRPDLTQEKFTPNPFADGQFSVPGHRLYKTGDLARYLPDSNAGVEACGGTIEFLGRVDQQVKIRGLRIEVGEIEAALLEHPAIREAVVTVREEEVGGQRLVAYLVPDKADVEAERTQVSLWQNVYEDDYSRTSVQEEATFNIVGWNSSYTGQAIPAAEMAEWVTQTVQEIMALKPQRVLEIGCGTGLLLSAVAPHCAEYWGTDYSQNAIKYVARLQQEVTGLAHVNLLHRMADDFTGIAANSFDGVIINSVIQYFPSIDYLLRVLQGAVAVVKPGGFIYVGDVRSFPLLEAYHASVQLYQAADEWTKAQLQERIQQRLLDEEELVVDPAFFVALKDHLPQIDEVQVTLKRGRYHNEMTRFRYQVLLRLAGEKRAAPPTSRPSELAWLDWQKEKLTLQAVRALLAEGQLALFGVQNVPNARLQHEAKALEWLTGEHEQTVGQFRQLLQSEQAGIDPEELWALALAYPYTVTINWSQRGNPFTMDVLFRDETVRHDANEIQQGALPAAKPWQTYANNPLLGLLNRTLVPNVRDFLRQQLPDYMVPSAFMLLDAFPLTPNGKVDRRNLPAPKALARSSRFVAPTTPTQARIAQIWCEVLRLEQVGIHDNFFELGGHSLLGTIAIARIRDTFQIEVPLRCLFESPTIAGLAAYVEQASPTLTYSAITPIARNGPLPLSFAQTRLWFLDQLGSGSDYHISFAWNISGKLNVTALTHSLTEIVRRHESLRTTFLKVNGEPRQVIAPPATVTPKVPVVDLQALAPDEQPAAVARAVNEDALCPFDLTTDLLLRATLLRLGCEAHVLLVTMHHIAFDGWSVSLFVQELTTLYDAFAKGQPAALPELVIQYADFAHWQRQWLRGAVLEKQLAYWTEQLAAAPRLQLPFDRTKTPHAQTKVIHFALSAELTRKLNQLSLRIEGGTLFMTLLAAFKILLSRYSNQEDIVVGTPIANRNRPEIERLIGFFVNTLVLRTDLSGNPSFLALVERVRETTIGAYEHQDLPFEQLVEALHPTRAVDENPLFQVMFALQTPDPLPEWPGLHVNTLEFDDPTARFDLEVDLWETPAGLRGTFGFRAARFAASTIERMVAHFQTLLQGIATDADKTIQELPGLPTAERRQLLVEWNNNQRPLPAAPTILQLFTAQVAAGATRVAVVAPAASPRAGETAGVRLTYQALDRQANQLAHYLQQLGVGPEVLVGIALDTEVRLIVAVLAVLKAGGAYLPLDPTYPTARLAFMAHDAQVKVLLTQEGLLPALPTPADATVVCLDRDWQRIAQEPTDAPTTHVTAEHLAYVIYTSGSTGKPKGVMVPHGNLVNAYEAWADAYRLAEVHSHLQLASFSFDVFVGNLVRALCSGGKLVLCPREWLLDAPRLSALMAAEQVDCAEFVPAVLRNLLAHVETSGQNPLHEMRLLIVGSDIWYMHEYQQVRRFCGPQTRLINSYGVTEATIDSSYFEQSLAHPPIAAPQTDEAGERMVPIGRPFANTQIYILDRNRQPVPIGVAGELYIGGAGLARGYLNRPELTQEKFIPNPFADGQFSVPGHRLYKTGDLARYLPDSNAGVEACGGTIEFLGRVDQQVKIRGLRIEVGEIEAVLMEHPDVTQAAVIVWEEEPNDQHLVAYVVSPAASTVTTNLRSFLQEKLPATMIPSAFVPLPALPLTPNGKVDRRALPAPDFSARAEALVLSRNPMELQLAPIWESILKRAPISVQDNFFALGGHSLLAVPLMMRIQQQFGVNLPLATLFQYPTIEELATLLRRRRQQDGAAWSPLVALQPNGNRMPFFCVHGIGGNVLNFYQLALHLGNEQPFYALQAVGLDGETPPLSTVEAMAACYLEALQVVQPHGPYLLGGHSFGGHIAFEMAQQLLDQGHEVARLVLLDSYAPDVDESTAPAKHICPDDGQANDARTDYQPIEIVTEIEAWFGKPIALTDEAIQGLSFDEQLKVIAQSMARANLLPPETESEQLRGLMQVRKTNEQIRYMPARVQPIRLALFRAGEEDAPANSIGATLGWQDFCQEAIELHIVPGDHFTMLAEPHVQHLAEQLVACLAKQ